MDSISKFLFIAGLLLLVAVPVIAQTPEPNPNASASDNAFELFPDSISNAFTNLLDQFWDPVMNKNRGIIQYSKEQLSITPDESFSSPDGIDLKIKESLQEKKNSASTDLVSVNMIVFPNKLQEVASLVGEKNGIVIRSLKYGNIVAADIPENKLLELAQSTHL